MLELFRERVAPSQALSLAEFVTGEGAECIQTPRLETTAVSNDIAVRNDSRKVARPYNAACFA